MSRNYSLIIACFILLTGISMKGQDTLRTQSNKWGTELNFNPFNGSLSLNNSNAQFIIRKFFQNNVALRLACTVNYIQNNYKSNDPYGTSPINYTERNKAFTIAINIGTEKHFIGTRRISPYIGWEIGVGYKKSKQEVTNNSNTTTIDGAWESDTSFYYGGSYYPTVSYLERGFWTVGANFVTGFDLYLTKGFYLGYEILFGIDYFKYSNIDITQSSIPSGTSTTNPKLNDESWKIGPKLVNGIRIGYVF